MRGGLGGVVLMGTQSNMQACGLKHWDPDQTSSLGSMECTKRQEKTQPVDPQCFEAMKQVHIVSGNLAQSQGNETVHFPRCHSGQACKFKPRDQLSCLLSAQIIRVTVLRFWEVICPTTSARGWCGTLPSFGLKRKLCFSNCLRWPFLYSW